MSQTFFSLLATYIVMYNIHNTHEKMKDYPHWISVHHRTQEVYQVTRPSPVTRHIICYMYVYHSLSLI